MRSVRFGAVRIFGYCLGGTDSDEIGPRGRRETGDEIREIRRVISVFGLETGVWGEIFAEATLPDETRVRLPGSAFPAAEAAGWFRSPLRARWTMRFLRRVASDDPPVRCARVAARIREFPSWRSLSGSRFLGLPSPHPLPGGEGASGTHRIALPDSLRWAMFG